MEHSKEVEALLARLEVRTEYLQRDIAEIKTDLRHLNEEIDAVKDRSFAQKIASL